jgi:hypothetical protein
MTLYLPAWEFAPEIQFCNRSAYKTSTSAPFIFFSQVQTGSRISACGFQTASWLRNEIMHTVKQKSFKIMKCKYSQHTTKRSLPSAWLTYWFLEGEVMASSRNSVQFYRTTRRYIARKTLFFATAVRTTNPALIQNVLGGKINILGGHSTGHSKQNVYMYMCPIPDGFWDRAISLDSPKIVDKKETLSKR